MPELFASNSFSFPAGYDYYYCDTQGNAATAGAYCDAANLPQHLAFFGGNPELLSENGDTSSAGVVWNATDDLVLELGYYNIEYYDKIVNVSIDDILRQNNLAGGTTGSVTRGSNGQIVSMQAGTLNLAEQLTSGWDFGASYNMDTDFGKFVFKGDLTRVIDFVNVQIDDDGSKIYDDNVGNIGLPEMKANMTISWSKDDFFAAWRMNYTKGQETTSTNPVNIDVDDIIIHNMQFGMHTSWDAEVVVGFRNILDEEVPFTTNPVGWRNYDATMYNPDGRTLFVKYEQSF